MRDSYIKDVKGGKLKRLSAFLADKEWNAAGGVRCVLCVVHHFFLPFGPKVCTKRVPLNASTTIVALTTLVQNS